MRQSDKLSERQKKMLDYIWKYIQDSGRPPTIREIGQPDKILFGTFWVEWPLRIE